MVISLILRSIGFIPIYSIECVYGCFYEYYAYMYVSVFVYAVVQNKKTRVTKTQECLDTKLKYVPPQQRLLSKMRETNSDWERYFL